MFELLRHDLLGGAEINKLDIIKMGKPLLFLIHCPERWEHIIMISHMHLNAENSFALLEDQVNSWKIRILGYDGTPLMERTTISSIKSKYTHKAN